MNKKVLAVIVAILIIAVAGAAIYMFTGNNSETNNSNNNNQSNNSAQSNNNENESTENTTTSDGGKTLIVYFSMSGNTEAVANIIHDKVGGDIIKLETVQTYPDEYNDLVDYAQEEQHQNARPQLQTIIENIDQYDTIFLGYPNWWGDMPMPIYTFLDTYDLSGKTIAPFITHGGSGLSKTPANIQSEEPAAYVTEGLAIYGSRARNSENEVNQWLSSLGF